MSIEKNFRNNKSIFPDFCSYEENELSLLYFFCFSERVFERKYRECLEFSIKLNHGCGMSLAKCWVVSQN